MYIHIYLDYTHEQDGATWDEDKVYGCVCDSSWSVGLGAGETQEPEWFGPDCSLRKWSVVFLSLYLITNGAFI